MAVALSTAVVPMGSTVSVSVCSCQTLWTRSWCLLVSTIGCSESVIRLVVARVNSVDRQAPIGDDNYLLLAARVRRLDSSQLRKTCSLPNWQWLDQYSTKVQHLGSLLRKLQWLSRYSCDTSAIWLLWGLEMCEQLFVSRWHLGTVKLGVLASSVTCLIFQLSTICCYVQVVGTGLKMGKMVSERRDQVGKCIKFHNKLHCHHYLEWYLQNVYLSADMTCCNNKCLQSDSFLCHYNLSL
jgi:hypothetical protein